jgi:hypothetical protein
MTLRANPAEAGLSLKPSTCHGAAGNPGGLTKVKMKLPGFKILLIFCAGTVAATGWRPVFSAGTFLLHKKGKGRGMMK